MKIQQQMGAFALAGGLMMAAPGCGSAAMISPQLSTARAIMAEARAGSAQRLEPDEVLAAQRTLNLAENQVDGSLGERHYAYLAERQTRVAMADARRTLIEQGVEEDEGEYQEELERIAHERGVELESTQDALADSDRVVAAQQQELIAADRVVDDQPRELIASDAALAAEQRARIDAEARAAAALQRLRALASVRVEADETIITLSGEVLFVTDSAELRTEARERLTAVAEAMQASPDQHAIVAGYTDSRGTDSHNRELSLARANTVRDFLMSAGVPAASIRSEGRGESNPIAGNRTADGRANNRRVEIILRSSSATVAAR